MRLLRRMYDWIGTKAHSKFSTLWLGILFFVEAIFFIPVDPILILFCIEKQKTSLWYATVATISSVIGGLFGYAIGYFLWNSIGIELVTWIISKETFQAAVEKYTIYENWAVLIAGFTPLPYKAITLSAGFCKLPLYPFIIYTLIARGARFFLKAKSNKIWGKKIKKFIDLHFNQLVVLFTLIIIVSFWLIK